MENLKKGDTVCVKKIKRVKIPPLARLKIVSIDENSIIVTGAIFLKKNEVFKIGESQMQYEESNRYKLAQAVKERVKLIKSKEIYATAEILSLATGNSKTYFSSQSAKSKFLSRGDLSENTYQAMLTDLAFAEREVLGIGAKAVEEPSDAEIQMVDFANSVKEKPKSNKPLFIGVLVVISIVLILFILNNYLQVV